MLSEVQNRTTSVKKSKQRSRKVPTIFWGCINRDAVVPQGEKRIGKTALAGLALLESGVDEQNPVLQSIIESVRSQCLQVTQTYDISACIMFLDRLGQSQDRSMIQFLGVRLMSGQNSRGAWSYQCGFPIPPETAARLRKSLSQESRLTNTRPPASGSKDPKKTQGRSDLPENPVPKKTPSKVPESGRESSATDHSGLHQEVRNLLRSLQEGGGATPMIGNVIGDNSNTQFAALGLWCTRKYGVPIEKPMKLLDKYFRGTQTENGGWPYTSMPMMPKGMSSPVPISPSTPSMTCAGLIGLAVSYGATESMLRSRSTNPNSAKGHGSGIGEDRAVKAAFKFLANSMAGGRPAGPGQRTR